MNRLCFQYLAIFSNENLPKSIQIVPRWVEYFAQNQIILKLIAKDFLNMGLSGGISPNLVTLLLPQVKVLFIEKRIVTWKMVSIKSSQDNFLLYDIQ